MLGTSIEINNKSLLVLALQRSSLSLELNSQKHLSFAVKLKDCCGNKLLTTPGYAKLYLAEKDV